MAISKIPTITLLVLFSAIIGFPEKTQALIPYTRPLWDMMLPTEDPFKILEQTPLTIPKNLETLNLARADWKETAGEHVITLDVPGMKRDNIKIEMEDNRVLRVSGERSAGEEERDGDRWHRAERTNGKFWRQFRLPANADVEHITAHLEDGVLKIRVPKVAEEKRKQSRVIDISEQRDSSGEDIKATKASA